MEEPSSENVAQSAFMCQFCNQQNVKWKCEDCGVFLCNSCKEKIHPRLKSSDTHWILSIQDIGKNQSYDNEPWFHGRITYAEVEGLLHKYKYMADGAFLIRESLSSIGNYSLDSLINGKPTHIRIRTKEEYGHLKYYTDGKLMFDNLNDLVEHLKRVPARRILNGVDCGEFKITEPIPKETICDK